MKVIYRMINILAIFAKWFNFYTKGDCDISISHVVRQMPVLERDLGNL